MTYQNCIPTYEASFLFKRILWIQSAGSNDVTFYKFIKLKDALGMTKDISVKDIKDLKTCQGTTALRQRCV